MKDGVTPEQAPMIYTLDKSDLEGTPLLRRMEDNRNLTTSDVSDASLEIRNGHALVEVFGEDSHPFDLPIYSEPLSFAEAFDLVPECEKKDLLIQVL